MLIESPFNEIIMNEITEFIRTRRSVVIRNLNNQPVPQADLDLIIDCGLRVPDHAVLAPWRLVVMLPAQASCLGTTILAPEFKRLNPDATEAMLAFEEGRFNRTGVVIAVLSCPQQHPKIPVWEMQLSAGAVCQNLLSSALALGYGAQWVTEWYAYMSSCCARWVAILRQTNLLVLSILARKMKTPRRDVDLTRRMWSAIIQHSRTETDVSQAVIAFLH